MIEVEQNFDLKPGDKERLINGAELISKKTFADSYFDNKDYALTANDYWLRTRNGKFELKVPLNKIGGKRITDQYRELETDAEIAAELNLKIETNLAETLQKSGYFPFATITTIRESYQKGEFHLDFDEMDFGFTTFEAELMVNNEDEIPAAEQKIIGFAKMHGIIGTEGRGKVIEYLYRNNPKHYKILERAGVI